MAGGKRKHDSRLAQLSLFDEKEMADMEPVKDSTEEAAPADPAPAVEPTTTSAEIPAVSKPAKEPAALPEQTEEREAAIKAKHKKDQEVRLAALWKARGKK